MDSIFTSPLLVRINYVVRSQFTIPFVELDPWPDVEGPGERVVGDAPGLGELRSRLPVLVEADQALSHGCADHVYCWVASDRRVVDEGTQGRLPDVKLARRLHRTGSRSRRDRGSNYHYLFLYFLDDFLFYDDLFFYFLDYLFFDYNFFFDFLDYLFLNHDGRGSGATACGGYSENQYQGNPNHCFSHMEPWVRQIDTSKYFDPEHSVQDIQVLSPLV